MRCRALCVGIDYKSQLVETDAARRLSSMESRALVHVGLELVRNAITHGAARCVEIELFSDAGVCLSVRDDGSGLTREVFHAATGGLSAAQAWLSHRGGSIELIEPPRSPSRTEVCVFLPCAAEA